MKKIITLKLFSILLVLIPTTFLVLIPLLTNVFADSSVYDGTKPMISISFDHAFLTQIPGIENMTKFGYQGSVWLIFHTVNNETLYMNSTYLLKLQNAGWTLDSHSWDHINISKAPYSKVYNQTVMSKFALQNYGFKIAGFEPPYSLITNASRTLIAQNYKFTFPYAGGYNTVATLSGPNSYKAIYGVIGLHAIGVGQGPESLPAIQNITAARAFIDNVIAKKGWGIIHFHQLLENATGFNSKPELFWQVLQYIKQKKDAGLLNVVTENQALGIVPQYVPVNNTGTVYRSDTGINGLYSPKYREWNASGSSWTKEVELPPALGFITTAKIAYNPTQNWTRTITTENINGGLNLYVCQLSCNSDFGWKMVNHTNLANIGKPNPNTPYRHYDMAYEHSSGRLAIVYDKATNSINDIYYRTYYNNTLSNEVGLNYTGLQKSNEDVRFIDLASNPTLGSNEIAMIIEDATTKSSYTFIWNSTSSTWGNEKVLSSNMGANSLLGESVGVGYQTTTGNALFFSGNGPDSSNFVMWNGKTYTGIFSVDPNKKITGNQVVFANVKSDPISGRTYTCQLDSTGGISCIQGHDGMFTFGSFITFPGTGTHNTTKNFDLHWNETNGKALLVYQGLTDNKLSQSLWDGTNWNTSVDSIFELGTSFWLDAGSNPLLTHSNVTAFWLKQNNLFQIGSLKWDGTSIVIINDTSHQSKPSGVDTIIGYQGMDVGR